MSDSVSITDFEMHETIANKNYIPRNLIAVNIRPLTTKVENLAECIKDLIECHALEITGITSGMRIDVRGKTDLHLVAEDCEPTFLFPENYGKPCGKVFQLWMQERVSAVNQGDPRGGTIDVMFIEPDPLMKNVVDAWLCKDMFFNEFPGTQSTRRLDESEPEPVVYRIKFECATERGGDVWDRATKLLAGILDNLKNPTV